jgi:hypothetical protein
VLGSQSERNVAAVADVGLQAVDGLCAGFQPFHARFEVSCECSIREPPLHQAAQLGQGRHSVQALLHRDGEVVAEPLPRDVDVFDVQLQLVELVIELGAVETEAALQNVGYAAEKHLSKRAAEKRVVSEARVR